MGNGGFLTYFAYFQDNTYLLRLIGFEHPAQGRFPTSRNISFVFFFRCALLIRLLLVDSPSLCSPRLVSLRLSSSSIISFALGIPGIYSLKCPECRITR